MCWCQAERTSDPPCKEPRHIKDVYFSLGLSIKTPHWSQGIKLGWISEKTGLILKALLILGRRWGFWLYCERVIFLIKVRPIKSFLLAATFRVPLVPCELGNLQNTFRLHGQNWACLFCITSSRHQEHCPPAAFSIHLGKVLRQSMFWCGVVYLLKSPNTSF